MAIEDTSLIAEVNAILGSRETIRFKRPVAELRTENDTIPIIKIMALEIRRHYSTSHSDVVFADVIIPEGVFNYRVFPNRENLIMTIFMYPTQGLYQDGMEDEPIDTQSFRAILHTEGSKVIEGDSMMQLDEAAMDISTIRQHRFELIDLTAEQMRLMTVGTVLRDTTPEEGLKYLMSHVSSQVEVEDELTVQGVDVVPMDHTETLKQFVIPHGTPVTDLADLFQNSVGLYGTGVGTYLQKGIWYVYPLYDHTRFEKSERTLTLIRVPPRRLAGVDRTYRKTANQTIALCTGQVASIDVTEDAYLNQGNGVRFANPDRLFKAFGVSDQNKTTAMRNEVVSEAITVERKTELNFAPFADDQVTKNPFRQLSSLASRAGSFITLLWDYSDVDSIYPGQPVRFMYEANNEVFETDGIVLEAIHVYMSGQPGVIAGAYTSQTALLIYVNRKLDWLENENESGETS